MWESGRRGDKDKVRSCGCKFVLLTTMPALTEITTLPHHILPEEHKQIIGSTPQSFSDIPPVLRHKEENVTITLDPPIQEFASPEYSRGTIYVIERYVLYVLLRA